MNDGRPPKPGRWGSISDPKYVIATEVDRETYDWLFRDAAERGLTRRRWVGLKLILEKALEDFERLKREEEGTNLEKAFKVLERLKGERGEL